MERAICFRAISSEFPSLHIQRLRKMCGINNTVSPKTQPLTQPYTTASQAMRQFDVVKGVCVSLKGRA